jgi:hypothetical protein
MTIAALGLIDLYSSSRLVLSSYGHYRDISTKTGVVSSAKVKRTERSRLSYAAEFGEQLVFVLRVGEVICTATQINHRRSAQAGHNAPHSLPLRSVAIFTLSAENLHSPMIAICGG